MATSTIALRFRETTPGVDTISAHRQVLAQHGAVWWGWWKKFFEEVNVDAIRVRFAHNEKIAIMLVDRSTERAFFASCIKFATRDQIDLKLVPEYYQEEVEKVAGFFLFTAIIDTKYDVEVADALGEQTFLWIGDAANPRLGHIAAPSNAIGRSCILHLSDLHFGADYAFKLQGQKLEIGDPRRTLTECLVADLERLNRLHDIAAVIVTGDFMSRGEWASPNRDAALAEFKELRSRLGLTEDQVIAVPGNHDVIRYPNGKKVDTAELSVGNQTNYDHETQFRLFVDELVHREWRASLNYVRRVRLERVDLLICVLNSCTIAATEWTEYGYVGRNGLDAIHQLSRESLDRPTFRFLALHHHLLPVANVEAPNSRGVTLTLDASDILAEAQKAGINVAMHGHQHKPKVSLYQNLALNGESSGSPIHIVANGSAGVKNARLPAGERNTYCLFGLREDFIELWIRELRLDGVAGAELFRGTLQSLPAHPKDKTTLVGA